MQRWWRSLNRGEKIAIIGVVVTALGVLLALRPSSQGEPPTTTEASAPTSFAAPTTAFDATETTSGTDTTSGGIEASPGGMVTKYLSSSSDPGTTDSQEIPWFAGFVNDHGSQDINGTSYTRNLTFNNVCSGPDPTYADYNLGRRYEKFQTVVGPGDTSTQTYHFEIWLDGERKFSLTMRRGQWRKISLPVNNVLTLRVSACNMHFEPLADRGGVYGEPRVTGKASEVPPPTTG
jgi:hypothetical protein